MIPKVIFKKLSLEENIDLVKTFFFGDTTDLDVYNFTIKLFPELATIDRTLPKEEIYSLIEDVVTREYKNSTSLIEKEIVRYSKIWNQYNDKYFQALCSYLNINWPTNKNIIYGYIGILPVFPRFLENFSFAVNTNLSNDKIIEVVAHETLHFLWFEKWKELYPDYLIEEFDAPYLPWKYSEMVTDPILNSKEIHDVLKITEKAYSSFYDIRDGDKHLMDVLKEIYNSDKSIEERIKMGYEYIQSKVGE